MSAGSRKFSRAVGGRVRPVGVALGSLLLALGFACAGPPADPGDDPEAAAGHGVPGAGPPLELESLQVPGGGSPGSSPSDGAGGGASSVVSVAPEEGAPQATRGGRSSAGRRRGDPAVRDLIEVRPVESGGDLRADEVPSPADGSDGETASLPSHDALVDRLQELSRLGRRLSLGEQLERQDLIARLVALHLLGVGDPARDRDLIHDAYRSVPDPRNSLRYLMAAFYDDLGLAELRDEVLAAAAVESTKGSATKSAEGTPQPRIRPSGAHPARHLAVEDVRVVAVGERRLPSTSARAATVHAGDVLRIEFRARGLTDRAVSDGLEQQLDVDVSLRDEQGVERDRRRLQPYLHRGPRQREVVELVAGYEIALRVRPGKYELRLRFTDPNSGEAASERLAVTVTRR